MISQKALEKNTLVINPGKVLDNNNAHEMADAISTAQAEGYKHIILDMRELEFLSSAGVGSILSAVDISRGKGGDIVLCNASEKILHILEVLDLLDYLTIKPNQEVAKEFCAAKG
jgi:anti-sigma B factor antagonist